CRQRALEVAGRRRRRCPEQGAAGALTGPVRLQAERAPVCRGRPELPHLGGEPAAQGAVPEPRRRERAPLPALLRDGSADGRARGRQDVARHERGRGAVPAH
ncbi:hypothetical protein BN1708_020090, partial [Verticillium longisporum]